MCSKLFGKGTLDSFLGDALGGIGGFLLGGPAGAALGAGLGGAAGEALGGGSLIQDIGAGGLGAGLAGGVSALGEGLAEGAFGAGAGAAGGVGDLAAGEIAPIAASDSAIAGGAGGAAADAGLGAAPALADVPAVAAPAALSGAPAIASAPGAALTAFADPTSLASGVAGDLGSIGPAGVAGDVGAASPLDQVLAEGAAGTLPGQTETAGQVASEFAASGEAVPVPPTAPWGGSVGAGITDFLSAHPFQAASTGISALGLGRSLLSAENPNPIPGMAQLSQLAGELGTTGTGLINQNAGAAGGVAGNAISQANVLENYLNTGTLPPAIQASLDQATKDGITNIRAQYAARGEPPGSTSEQQEVEALQQRAVIQGGTLAAQLYSQGVSLDTLASNIYTSLTGTGRQLVGAGAGAQESLINTGVALNTGVNNAIANLSSALGGGSRAIINGQTVTVPAAA